MTPFLQLIFMLLVIVFAAKTASYLSVKIGQPSVLGELLVGILLGPSLLNLAGLPFITDEHLGETIIHLGEIGVLLLMFIAGLELHLSDLAKNTKVSAYAGILGVLFPVLMGWGAGMLFGFAFENAVFLGLILGATSVSISAQTLMELNMLRTRVGLGLLGAAVFDDILVILLLSTALAIFGGGGDAWSIFLIFARIAGYLAASAWLGMKVLPWITRRAARLSVSQAALSLAVVVMFVYAIAAEVVGGMAAITGTFLAGLMFARTPERERIERGARALAYSFFVPVFFVSIGLGINLRELTPDALALLGVIVVIGIAGKIIGAGLGALAGGFTRQEALQLGAGMVSRGEVGLIVASIGLAEGYVDPVELSAVIGMVIVTTLVTPPMLRALFPAGQTGEVSSIPLEETNDVHDPAHS